MEQSNIKQIAVNDTGLIYGLGEDNLVYSWDKTTKRWTPYWHNYMKETESE